MHLIKKLYCRAFQTAFHLALPVLPYRTPRLLSSLAEIAPVLKDLRISSVLLVTDSTLFAAGHPAALQSQLKSSGIRCAVFSNTRANPTVENVLEARDLYISQRCQALIALGGGSPMDCAKAVGALIARPQKSPQQLRGLLKICRRLPPLIAIPTTAGTGSEVTVTAVITDPERRDKYTINDFSLIPSHAVLDPEMTRTLPPHLTASTGMDALTHAVEAYIGRSTSRETRALCLEAVELIFKNIEEAYRDGGNMKARRAMLLASHKAGIAFSKSYVGYVHAIAHSLGGEYNLPHGLTNSVLLPVVLEAYGTSIHKKLHHLGVAAGVCQKEDSPEDGAKLFIQAVYALNDRLHLPRAFDSILPRDIERMARHAEKEANPLYPVPVLMDARQLQNLYLKISKESFAYERT